MRSSQVKSAAFKCGSQRLPACRPTPLRQCSPAFETSTQVLVLEATSKPGKPAHFLCFDSEKKEAILSVRGSKARKLSLLSRSSRFT